MALTSQQGASNRRGCYLIAGIALLMVLVVIGLGLGWFGQVDRGKISDLPIAGGNST